MPSRVRIPSVAVLLFAALAASSGALAQAPSPAALPPPRGPERVAIIDMQGAIAGCNEGLRDFDALDKKFQPRRTEMARLGTELQNLQKQFNTQEGTMTPAARDALARSIDVKGRNLQRTAEDVDKEFSQQQNGIVQRILQKMGPILKKYAGDHDFGLVIDGSMPWPQGPVVMVSDALDITKAIVDAYNAQSPVAAPAPKVAK